MNTSFFLVNHKVSKQLLKKREIVFILSQIMNRIDRLFNILTLLQSKKYVPAEKIADKFNLSIRTVYRDIKALGEAGIPVSFEPQRGYFIV